MTHPETAAVALSTLLSVGMLWILITWFYRSYRIDKFRADVFALRAELFDLAVRGDLEFDDPAYRQLRNTMNGFLRFADRLSILSSLLVVREMQSAVRRGEAVIVEKSEWEVLVDALEPGIRAEVLALRSRMHVAVFEQIIFSSPFFLMTTVPFALGALVRFAGQRLVWRALHRLYLAIERAFERAVRPLDEFALHLGTAEA